MAPSSSPNPVFRSCLLVSAPEDKTLHFVRAMHDAGFAVLDRIVGPSSTELALSGNFDLIAWVTSAERAFDRHSIASVAHSDVRVIALVQDLSPAAVAECLQAGADAVLALDADGRVVVAQVHAVLRRRAQFAHADLGILRVGDLLVDTDRCEVTCAGRFVNLTASEFRIIEHMARNPGRVLRPQEVLNAVTAGYRYDPREAQEVFKVYVRRIRRKLEPCEDEPRYLVTVRGMGYRLDAADSHIESAQTA